MVFKKKFFLFIFLQGFSTFAMEETKPHNIAQLLEDLTPFSNKPITNVPHYLFENPNQSVQFTWDTEKLKKFKASVSQCKVDTLRNQFPELEKYTKNAECFDWILCLNYLEQEYLTSGKDLLSTLTFAEIIKVNALLTRLTSPVPGQIRTQFIYWRVREFTKAEDLFLQVMDKEECWDKFGLRPDDAANISVDSIKNLLLFFKNNSQFTDIDPHLINIEEPLQWITESSQLSSVPALPVINYKRWLSKRIYGFPKANQIADLVKQLLLNLKNAQLHPIIKAALLWYELIRIHPFNEANKRTARALASILLLQNGYLPPLIKDTDGQRYVTAFLDSCINNDKEHEFVKFIVEMIIKIQLTERKSTN